MNYNFEKPTLYQTTPITYSDNTQKQNIIIAIETFNNEINNILYLYKSNKPYSAIIEYEVKQ